MRSLVFVSHSLPPDRSSLENVGGMQRVADELLQALRARRDVRVREIVLRVPWRHAHRRALVFLASLVVRLPQVVTHGDTVLFSSVTSALPTAAIGRALRRRGATLATIAHGLDVTQPHPVHQAAVRAALGAMDLILPVSRATEAEVARRTDTPTEVVPNGLNLDRFERSEPPTTRAVFREERNEWGDDAFVLLSVGRQIPRKGFAWFAAEVMPKLPPNVHWCLAGDGPERARIEHAVRRAGLQNRVHVLGLTSEAALARLRAQADLFVMPNLPIAGDMEGFGIVMLEAAAYGVPTIAADLEGIRDVVDETTGVRVRAGDADAFATAIRDLCSDRARRTKLGEGARQRARGLGWDHVAERYVTALTDARAKRGR